LFRYVVAEKENGIYRVWVEKWVDDSCMDYKWSGWSDINDSVHLTDCLESAYQIGSELLDNFCS
jgi:hypothetical protein